MKKTTIFIRTFVLLFFFSAYGYADYNQILQGTWTTSCIFDDSNGIYRKITMVISENELSSTHDGSWSESECLNNSYFYTSTLTGTFSIGDDIGISESKELDIMVSSCTVTWLTDDSVNYVNANSWYGINDWQKDVPRDISGKTQPSMITYPSIGETFFSAIKIEGNKAYLGTDVAGFSLNEEFRSTTLENWFYTKDNSDVNVSKCDIDNDGKVGIEEAIYSLQIISGIKTESISTESFKYKGTGVDSSETGSDNYEYELNIDKISTFISGTLKITEGDDTEILPIKNGSFKDNTLSFMVTNSGNWMYHFVLFQHGDTLNGGVVELYDGCYPWAPQECVHGLDALTKVNMQLVVK